MQLLIEQTLCPTKAGAKVRGKNGTAKENADFFQREKQEKGRKMRKRLGNNGIGEEGEKRREGGGAGKTTYLL